MSETVTEEQAPPETTDDEPQALEPPETEPITSPGEPEPEQEPDEDEDESEQSPAPDEEPEQPTAALDEKELERRQVKLENENRRHASRVGEIMADDAGNLIPCPVCMDGIAGWIYPPEVQQLPEEAIARIRQVIGLPDYTTFKSAVDASACPDCDGLGEVVTGSKVPGYETKTCERCKKMGWIRVGGPAPATNGHVEPEQTMTGPTVYQADDADPEIRHLRERGFTVIPPANFVNG